MLCCTVVLFIHKTYVVGTLQKCLSEMLCLNICFDREVTSYLGHRLFFAVDEF